MKLITALLTLLYSISVLATPICPPGHAALERRGNLCSKSSTSGWMKFFDPAIHKAVHDGNIRKVRELIVANEKNLNLANDYGNTPLHIASRYHQTDIVDVLLREGGVEINIRNANGQTPFFVASMYNYYGIATKLARKGADVNSKDKFGNSILHVAASSENTQLVRFLLNDINGIEKNIRDKAGATPLAMAVMRDDYDAAHLLLKAQADVNVSRYDGVSPLHLAVGNDNIAMIEMLLAHGAQFNCRDKMDKTPLDYAVAGGFYKVVEVLKRVAEDQDK